MKYIFSVIVLFAGFFGFIPGSVSAVSCSLEAGKAYRAEISPRVYYITESCTKVLLDNDHFFSYFHSWDEVNVVAVTKLTNIKTDTAPLVYGPQYFPRTGSLVKSPNSPDIYYIILFTKNKIASELLFSNMGLSWSWVETIPQATLDKFIEGDNLESTDQIFKEGLFFFRYSDNPNKIHLLLPDFKTGKMLRHYMKNDVLVDYIGYRRDRIPTLSPLYQFQIGAPIDNLEEFFTAYLGEAVQNIFSGFSGLGNNALPTDLLYTPPVYSAPDTSVPSDQPDPWEDFFNRSLNDTDEITPPADESPSINYLQVDPNFDHITGNVKAKVTLIEYVDFECPYCKQFHATMKQAMEKYGDRVRWVFRHYPLDFHTQARAEALASECAGEQGKFWPFADLIFEKTNSGDSLDLGKLSEYAVQVGVDAPTFNRCYKAEKFAAKVDEDIADAQAAGALGTPYTLLLNARGEVIPLNGAIPFAELDAEIENAL